jgi:Na+-transporting methylmalonyl-CoA/oxaloacetate decarboxylase gamma subunit
MTSWAANITIMKQLLIILGAIFLALIVLAAVCIGIGAVKGSALDKQSKAYVDSTVPVIVSTWDEHELLSRASPEFTQATDKDELDKLYTMFRRLGRLRQYQGSQGQSYMSLTTQNGKRTTAVYTAKASFDSGSAVIKVTLTKHGDQWQIEGFYVDSDVFLQH